jgi:hypothetical protein
VTATRTTVRGRDVRVGDRLLGPPGDDLTVTRIDSQFMGRPDMIAVVEDSAVRWLKRPLPLDSEVEIVRDLPG